MEEDGVCELVAGPGTLEGDGAGQGVAWAGAVGGEGHGDCGAAAVSAGGAGGEEGGGRLLTERLGPFAGGAGAGAGSSMRGTSAQSEPGAESSLSGGPLCTT